jgi:hypothetical protein
LRDPSFDPAAVLLALSAQQLGIMQTTLTNQLTGARSQIGKIAEMGAASVDVGRLREHIIAGEEASIQQVLAEVKSLGSKYRGGDASSLTVSEADNQRMKQAELWAAERGFSMEPMTRLVQPTQAEIDAAKTAGIDPPTPKLVADEAAVRRNLEALTIYQTDVRLGIADNPAIRRQLAEAPGAMRLLGRLQGLGYDAEIETLSDLEAAASGLQKMALDAVATLAQASERLKSLADAIGAKGTQFEQLVSQQKVQPWPQDEADRLKAELKLQELEDAIRAILEDYAAAFAGIEAQGMGIRLSGDIVANLVGDLSDSERAKVQHDLTDWKSKFATEFSVTSGLGSSPHSSADMRRNYL